MSKEPKDSKAASRIAKGKGRAKSADATSTRAAQAGKIKTQIDKINTPAASKNSAARDALKAKLAAKPISESLEKPDQKPDPKPASKPSAKPTSKTPREKSGLSLSTALGLAIISAGLGGAIGWFGPKMFDPANAAPAQAIKSLQSDQADLQNTAQALQSELTRVQSELTSAQAELSDMTKQITRLDRLEAAEAARAAIDITAEREAAIAPLAEKLDALESLTQSEDMPDGAATTLLARLNAVETQMTQTKEQLDIAQADMSAQILDVQTLTETKLSESREARELTANIIEAERAAAEPVEPTNAAYDLIANFPKADMLKALRTQQQNTPSTSWLRKIFEKHVQTGGQKNIDSVAIINEAERLLRAGDTQGAVEAIESLNSTLRAAAYQWLTEARKTL